MPTKLSALPPERLRAATAQLVKAGVAVTVLPATDLYLMGREATHTAPRGLTLAHKLAGEGVVCSVATNNVLNPFTPFGDASLLRMANFYANVAHASVNDFDTCLDLVTELPARLMKSGITASRSETPPISSCWIPRTAASRSPSCRIS